MLVTVRIKNLEIFEFTQNHLEHAFFIRAYLITKKSLLKIWRVTFELECEFKKHKKFQRRKRLNALAHDQDEK